MLLHLQGEIEWGCTKSRWRRTPTPNPSPPGRGDARLAVAPARDEEPVEAAVFGQHSGVGAQGAVRGG
jgi:hypothetical protein